MSSPIDENELDPTLAEAFGSPPQADFETWRRRHAQAVACLTPQQMESIIGISVNLINQYRALYDELNVPEHARTLERLKRTVLHTSSASQLASERPSASEKSAKKGEK